MQYTNGDPSFPIEVDSYDYGAGGNPGVLLSKTLTTYATQGNATVPQTVITQDGSSNTLSKTTFGYDEYSLQPTTGTPQHASVPNARGNVTSVNTYSTATAFLARHFSYYDTGTLYKATDVNGAVTTYTYGSGSCGNSFPTGVGEPLNLLRSMTWDCNGGVTTASTDENTQTSTSYYTGSNFTKTADANFWRPYAVTDQQGNATTFSYPNENAFESTLLFNSNSSVADQLTTLEGFGRPLLNQTKQAPSSTNYDTVSDNYDAAGCGDTGTTVPYVGTAGQNSWAPGLSKYYDPLCRLTEAADSGGGTVILAYNQNDVLQTIGPAAPGEGTKVKQLEYDALGRLISVCEVTAGTQAWPAGNCAQTNAKTGYWTTYAYGSSGGNTTVTVTQNAQSSTKQTRTYLYDLLGRLVKETNPEAGTTQYVYDVSSGTTCAEWGYTTPYPGDLVEKDDANGNATCLLYDAMHRVLATYNFGPNTTPSKHFIYDYVSTQSPNSKGRLSEAFTCTAGAPSCAAPYLLTDEMFGYSARGESTDLYELTPHSGSYYHTNATYWPNGALNQLSGIPSVPATIYGWYGGAGPGLDGEGRITRVSPSGPYTDLVPFQGVSYNSASQVTNVTYGLGDNDAFRYDSNTGRMTNYTYNVGAAPQSVVGNLTWNPNGTLQQLAIADPLNPPNTQTCNYGYDDLSRILTNSCGSAWNQNFTIDPFGNTTKTGSSSFTPMYDQTTNRIFNLTGCTILYDANGNPLNDCARGTQDTYSWDAEGHAVTLDGNTVVYDALGRAVEVYATNSPTYYGPILYSPMGQKLATVSVYSGTTYLSRAYIPLPGGGTAVYGSSGLMFFWHPDWLGTARLGTTPTRGLYLDRAYAPYGENYANSGATWDLSFTGKSQDIISSTYDFPFRNYSAISGRWYSPDPAGMAAVDPTNPQTWNRYAYVGNNPLNFVDPMGTCYLAQQIIITVRYTSDDGSVNQTDNFPGPIGYQFLYPGPCLNQIGCPGAAYSISNGQLSCSSAAQIQQQCENGGCFQMDSSSGSAANNGSQQPQQPCYGGNSLTDKGVNLFSLLRLPETWKEWVVGGGAKLGFFAVAKAGAKSAGGEESLGAAAIGTTGSFLGLAATAATVGATIVDARCQIGGTIAPSPH